MSDKVNYKGDEYVKFRPTYPEEIYSIIYSFYQEKATSYEKAIDVGCGTGQVASELAKKFKQVYGVDRLPDMINNAIRQENIHYSISDAETLDFDDHSIDLVTVATAFHWFNHAQFFKEAKRVLKPNGVLAVWTYFIPIIKDDVVSTKILKEKYIERLMPYGNPDVHHAISLYRDIEFPFQKVDRYICPKSEDIYHQSKKNFDHPLLEKEMSLTQFSSYLKTASFYVNYKKDHDDDPVDDAIDEIANHLGVTDKNTYSIHLEWPVGLVLCRD